MSDNTNMLTIRTLGGVKLIEVNGREIPFVRSVQHVPVDEAENLHMVSLVFDVGQVNEVDHGEDITPRATGNPRADAYLRTIVNVYATVRNARWWQVFSVLREVRAQLETLAKSVIKDGES